MQEASKSKQTGPQFLEVHMSTCCDYFLAFLRLRIPKIADAVPIIPKP